MFCDAWFNYGKDTMEKLQNKCLYRNINIVTSFFPKTSS